MPLLVRRLQHLLWHDTDMTVLAILAASLNDRQVSRYGNNIIDALKIGPTVYPIVFAAIAARFMKKIASVKAERGTSLGVRSQLPSVLLSDSHSSSNN